MYLRIRNSNLSIERAVYEPAVKDSQGNVIKPAVRSTLYIGSFRASRPFGRVPQEILQQLSDIEKQELKEALKENEPKRFQSFDLVPDILQLAASEIRTFAIESGSKETKRQLDLKMKAADVAWATFFKAAQEHGLKRNKRASKRPEVRFEPPNVQPNAQS